MVGFATAVDVARPFRMACKDSKHCTAPKQHDVNDLEHATNKISLSSCGRGQHVSKYKRSCCMVFISKATFLATFFGVHHQTRSQTHSVAASESTVYKKCLASLVGNCSRGKGHVTAPFLTFLRMCMLSWAQSCTLSHTLMYLSQTQTHSSSSSSGWRCLACPAGESH